MARLVMVRHGQSTWNLQRRLQGQSAEPELTDLGREQAREAAARVRELVGEVPVRLISSDLTRARQTAEIVASHVGAPVEIDERLREQGLGALEGRGLDEMVALPLPEDSHITEIAWADGAETIADVHARLRPLVADLRTAAGVDVVVLVSHGDTLRVLLAVLDGLGHREVEWIPIENGAVITRELSAL